MTHDLPPFETWKPAPKPPRHDVRYWSLLIPAAFSALGFFAFAVMAFSFTEMALLPIGFRRGLVVVGAFSLAIGGEIGTLSNTIEVYRKSQTSRRDGYAEANRWDWAGLVISLFATLGEFLIAFAALLGVSATWSSVVQMWGPIALGLMAALDAYVGFMEVGFYLASYDKRQVRWLRARDAYYHGKFDADDADTAKSAATTAKSAPVAAQDGGSRAAVAETALAAVEAAAEPQRRVAGIRDWRSIYAQMNGDRATLTVDDVADAVTAAGLALPSRRTMQDWKREAQNAQN